MKELNDEIKETINMMQADIDDGVHSELRYHLVCLMEMKRERLVTGTGGQTPYKRWNFGDPDEPLTVDELIAGGVLVNGGDK